MYDRKFIELSTAIFCTQLPCYSNPSFLTTINAIRYHPLHTPIVPCHNPWKIQHLWES